MPFTYLADYALTQGLSSGQAAFLVSIIGIFNTVGRPLFGWLAGRTWTNSINMYILMCILGGAITMACSHLHSHVLIAVYAAMFGCYVGEYLCHPRIPYSLTIPNREN